MERQGNRLHQRWQDHRLLGYDYRGVQRGFEEEGIMKIYKKKKISKKKLKFKAKKEVIVKDGTSTDIDDTKK